MHVFGAADDGIDGAGLDALGAADAVGFDDHRDLRQFVFATAAVVGKGRNTQQMSQCARASVATRRAVIDTGIASGHGFGIRAAAVITALPTLGLRQQLIDAFDQRNLSFSLREWVACSV